MRAAGARPVVSRLTVLAEHRCHVLMVRSRAGGADRRICLDTRRDRENLGKVGPWLRAATVPMISIKGVNKHFGALHVLKDINLEVDRGQVVVVLGPSGSGKSTLCRTINRLETIDSGTISIDGEVLPAEGRKLAQLRSDVGMVFQSFNLFAHKTILENVMLAPMKVRKVSADAGARAGDVSAGAGRCGQSRPRSIRRSCPAASSSGWPSPDRWP